MDIVAIIPSTVSQTTFLRSTVQFQTREECRMVQHNVFPFGKEVLNRYIISLMQNLLLSRNHYCMSRSR